VNNSLKKKDFKQAGVPHYKSPDMSPIQVLNSIIKGKFDAPMLANLFQVQVLHPKHKRLEIHPLMNTLKQMSMWISTNKKLSAEKTISKRLAEVLTLIMSLSTSSQRKKYRPIPYGDFKYQNDVDKNKFEKLCQKQGEKYYAQYPDLLASVEYTNYIKDPFNKEKMFTYLKASSPHQNVSGYRGERISPPYGNTYDSLTTDVGIFDRQVRKIDVRHYNAYCAKIGLSTLY
jgi:hypothetical protein